MPANTLNSRKIIDKPFMDNFFEFVNKEGLERLHESDLTAVLMKYTRFLCQHESKYAFLNFRAINERYVGPILRGATEEELGQMGHVFAQLQGHLRSKLQQILNSVESGAGEEPDGFIQMKGTRKVLLDPDGDSFVDGFWPDGIDSEGKLDLAKEKILADLAFAEMVQDFQLKPSRFGQCERDKCGNFFYHYAAKEKKYCSTRCSNAARQARFIS